MASPLNTPTSQSRASSPPLDEDSDHYGGPTEPAATSGAQLDAPEPPGPSASTSSSTEASTLPEPATTTLFVRQLTSGPGRSTLVQVTETPLPGSSTLTLPVARATAARRPPPARSTPGSGRRPLSELPNQGNFVSTWMTTHPVRPSLLRFLPTHFSIQGAAIHEAHEGSTNNEESWTVDNYQEDQENRPPPE